MMSWCDNGANIPGITNHFLTGFKTDCVRLEPIPDTGKRDKNLRVDRSWLKGKPTTVLLLKKM